MYLQNIDYVHIVVLVFRNGTSTRLCTLLWSQIL